MTHTFKLSFSFPNITRLDLYLGHGGGKGLQKETAKISSRIEGITLFKTRYYTIQGILRDESQSTNKSHTDRTSQQYNVFLLLHNLP